MIFRVLVERRARFLAAICASCLGLDGAALAAESVASDAPSAGAEDRAAAAFQRAMTAYEARDLNGALAAMRESLRLSGRAELLYNIARIEGELGSCSEALADYREYLSRVPEGRYRTEAEQASQELAQRCQPADLTAVAAPVAGTTMRPASAPALGTPPPDGAPSPVAAPPPVATPPSSPALATRPLPQEPSQWPPAILGYSAIALGLVAGASSIYFVGRAVDARDDFKASVDREVAGGAHADWNKLDAQHRHQTWAQVLAVGSGALIAGGIVIVALAPRQNTQAASSTQLHVTPGQVSISHHF